MLPDESKSIICKVTDERLHDRDVSLFVKREDLIHPEIGGNKWRKLKYNLEEAAEGGHETILSFGGAFSNHIAALACAGKLFGFQTIGVIRGEESYAGNPTLQYAGGQGMQLHFVDRAAYRVKHTPEFLARLKRKFGNFYLIPEGGSNCLAVKGCREILGPSAEFDYVCCSVGTGGTLAGLSGEYVPGREIWGFTSLKGGFLGGEIEGLLKQCSVAPVHNWQLITDYHFGGYAKFNHKLIDFINDFYFRHAIPLDPVYTGKLFYGVYDQISKGAFPHGSRILLVHSGGLQGISGFNRIHGPLIKFDPLK